MTKPDHESLRRRSIITGLGVAVAGAGAATMMPAHAQRSRGFAPARHDLDAWMDDLPGQHRIFIDSASATGGTDAPRYAFNLFNSQNNAYDGSDSDLAMIVCFRHASTGYGYNNTIWEKYAEHFAGLMQIQGPTPTSNPVSGIGGFTVEALAARGTQFAICNAATQLITSQIANATGAAQDEIYAEITANAIPNSRFVSAGVMALTRAQEYGYSLLAAG